MHERRYGGWPNFLGRIVRINFVVIFKIGDRDPGLTKKCIRVFDRASSGSCGDGRGGRWLDREDNASSCIFALCWTDDVGKLPQGGYRCRG